VGAGNAFPAGPGQVGRFEAQVAAAPRRTSHSRIATTRAAGGVASRDSLTTAPAWPHPSTTAQGRSHFLIPFFSKDHFPFLPVPIRPAGRAEGIVQKSGVSVQNKVQKSVWQEAVSEAKKRPLIFCYSSESLLHSLFI